MPRTFYRIIISATPDLGDFTSAKALGRSPPSDPTLARLWDGISVFATEAQAISKAKAYHWLGEFVARLEFATDAQIRWERTLRGRGHFTLWAEPSVLLACVVSTVPVLGVH